MRLLLVVAILIFAMPMTGFGWAEGTNILLDPHLMCKKTRRLPGKLSKICQQHRIKDSNSSLLMEIINGINLGFRECEFQFKNRRWNCSVLRRSMRKILMRDSRETSFVNAITSAGITYSVTKACSTSTLMECSCGRNGGQPQMVNAATAVAALERQQAAIEQNANKSKNRIANGRRRGNGGINRRRKTLRNIKFPDGEWEWGGCSDNVNFGFRYSRAFLDAKYRRRRDLRTLVKLHNNNAGRLAIRDAMHLKCKCHGLSGSCTVKTCWLKMPPFREVASRLRDKFDGATKVVLRNDGNSFMPDDDNTKQPTKYDLVYTDDSLDFCTANNKTGSLGTYERECNATSSGIDGCELLCCSRGHKHRIISEWVNCKCVFKWCCEVTCDKCLERRELNTCL